MITITDFHALLEEYATQGCGESEVRTAIKITWSMPEKIYLLFALYEDGGLAAEFLPDWLSEKHIRSQPLEDVVNDILLDLFWEMDEADRYEKSIA